jgi:crossover junction endodeoxyribonuclease RuvC
MLVLGIDPGLSGGYAFLNGARLEALGRMPTFKPLSQKARMVNARELVSVVTGYGPIAMAVIEMVHAMPAQGVSSTFTFGRATGAVEAIAMGCSRDAIWVAPAVWKRHFDLLKKPKASSLETASHFWPERGDLWKVKANDGVAEAALIAKWYLDTRLKRA